MSVNVKELKCVKKIKDNGYVHIPIQITRQLPTDRLEVKLVECEVDGEIKNCILLVPIQDNYK